MSDADIVKHIRFVFGITPYELGRLSDISTGHLYRIENGVKRLGRRAINKIYLALTVKNPDFGIWFNDAVRSQQPSCFGS